MRKWASSARFLASAALTFFSILSASAASCRSRYSNCARERSHTLFFQVVVKLPDGTTHGGHP